MDLGHSALAEFPLATLKGVDAELRVAPDGFETLEVEFAADLSESNLQEDAVVVASDAELLGSGVDEEVGTVDVTVEPPDVILDDAAHEELLLGNTDGEVTEVEVEAASETPYEDAPHEELLSDNTEGEVVEVIVSDSIEAPYEDAPHEELLSDNADGEVVEVVVADSSEAPYEDAAHEEIAELFAELPESELDPVSLTEANLQEDVVTLVDLIEELASELLGDESSIFDTTESYYEQDEIEATQLRGEEEEEQLFFEAIIEPTLIEDAPGVGAELIETVLVLLEVEEQLGIDLTEGSLEEFVLQFIITPPVLPSWAEDGGITDSWAGDAGVGNTWGEDPVDTNTYVLDSVAPTGWVEDPVTSSIWSG